VGIVAASVAVAAAIVIYESPELRRMADDLRRRVALALHSLGENVDPNREPRFNRPEDATGFYESNEMDADEETRRRQREEILYWNARREENEQRKSQEFQQRSRGSSFDDFLQPAGERGTFVYNSGANAWNSESSNLLRRRGNVEAARSLDASALANPFGDEYGIELDDRLRLLQDEHATNVDTPNREVTMSDIYNATPRVHSPVLAPTDTSPSSPPGAREVLFDFDANSIPDTHNNFETPVGGSIVLQPVAPAQAAAPSTTARSATLERDLAEDEYMTAGQHRNDDDDNDVDAATASETYASIQAWAQDSSNTGFYSPLPVSPQAPLSEPELISEGQRTPTDSSSVAWSGVDVAHEARDGVSEYDVMSESEDGIATPNSWSEVGSVVSEDE
ncbi:hypothetical protein BT67DRAFT_351864, partial [Trichocladium antarcticum]